MIRAAYSPLLVRSPHRNRPALGSWIVPALLSAAVLAVGVLTIGGYLLLSSAPPRLALDAPDGVSDVPLTSTVRVTPGGWGGRIESATLWRAPRVGGGDGREIEVPVQVGLMSQGWLPGETWADVRPNDGRLVPDSDYRLVVESSAVEAGFPLPRLGSATREVRFSTPASPAPRPQAEPAALDWEAPLRIDWNIPIDRFEARLSPPAALRAWVDPADRRISYVAVEQPQEQTRYEIAVASAVGTNGIQLQRPAQYAIQTPPRPRLLAGEGPIVTELGKPIRLRWSEPLADLSLETSPAVHSAWRLVPKDPALVEIRLDGLAQGERYEVVVPEAVSTRGAPQAGPRSIVVETPPALEVDQFLSGGGYWVPITARPSIVFSEPIRSRPQAEASITVQPSLPGRFEWLGDRQVQFVPSRGLPYDTRIVFSVRPGPDGPRSTAGGYLEEEAAYAFRTAPNKIIDVNVTRQTLALYEGDQLVRTFVVATGVPGADTPLGEFRVQYKMPKARFRGTNSATGQRYDLPDVNWVMAFQGDYTIHGAYWRQAFGTPGSNGCVSLTDADAKIVFDWAPEGTLVRIHY